MTRPACAPSGPSHRDSAGMLRLAPPARRSEYGKPAAEIRRSKEDLALAAAGAVLFLERCRRHLEQVDSSSGAIGTAVNHAIETCANIIAEAPVDDETRDRWLDRLWEAHPERRDPASSVWPTTGASCARPENVRLRADRLIGNGRDSMESEPCRRLLPRHDRFASARSSTPGAPRNRRLLDKTPTRCGITASGVRALAAMGRKAGGDPLRRSQPRPERQPALIARACEEILLVGTGWRGVREIRDRGQPGDDVPRDLRAIAKKYPTHAPAKILDDLVASTPGQGRQGFAAAKGCRAPTTKRSPSPNERRATRAH